MKPNDILKRALNQPPPKGNEDDITPPIQVYFLIDGKEIAKAEYSNKDFLNLLAKETGITNFKEAKLILDDGKKSYTFTLDIDEFTPNKLGIDKPMK